MQEPQIQLQKLSYILMRLNKEKFKTPGNETWIKPSLVKTNSLELSRNNEFNFVFWRLNMTLKRESAKKI